MTFGKRLRLARKLAGLTIKELGARTGIHPLTISKFEKERLEPSQEQLASIAETLQVKLEFFFAD